MVSSTKGNVVYEGNATISNESDTKEYLHRAIMCCNIFSIFSAMVVEVKDVGFVIGASTDYNHNTLFRVLYVRRAEN
jgi:hypothetical protein